MKNEFTLSGIPNLGSVDTGFTGLYFPESVDRTLNPECIFRLFYGLIRDHEQTVLKYG